MPAALTRFTDQRWTQRRRTHNIALVLLLSSCAVLLLGFHPYAEDGAIYAAAIQARLDPGLFLHDRVWVAAHTRYALFTPLVVAMIHVTRLPMETILFSLVVGGIAALIVAAGHLAHTCFPQQPRPWFAMLAVAVGAGLPVAGTALYAVDPYCTARTLSSPVLLLALSFALRRRLLLCLLCWCAGAAVHPLMALWGAVPILLTLATAAAHPRRWTVAGITLVVLAALVLFTMSSPESAAARQVALTRAYWFPAHWRWYEWLGALAPALLLVHFRSQRHWPQNSVFSRLAIAAVLTTALSVMLAFCFARPAATSLALARLQPLRSLHLVFLAFLAAGASRIQQQLRKPVHYVLCFFVSANVAAGTYAMQRSLSANSIHMEWPGKTGSRNGWQQAFEWCRSNTPRDALFALDADYIDVPGEDSVGFRAASRRSALPDRVKDAGIASVLPELAPAWQSGVDATVGLNHIPDAERIRRLGPTGATWIVLPRSAQTAFECPFQNSKAQVCRLSKP